MKRQQFKIGEQFLTATSWWRCTDRGTRTVCAIKIDDIDDQSWHVGPPFAVQEQVFDEYDMEGCFLDTHDYEKTAI